MNTAHRQQFTITDQGYIGGQQKSLTCKCFLLQIDLFQAKIL